MRLKGVLSDNRYFTGFWYHPEDLCRYHGSFQLLLESNFLQMKGQWIGYSESKQGSVIYYKEGKRVLGSLITARRSLEKIVLLKISYFHYLLF